MSPGSPPGSPYPRVAVGPSREAPAFLREAAEALDADRSFLTQGDVFPDDLIDGYLELKWEEIFNFEHTPHPIEFQMYYSV